MHSAARAVPEIGVSVGFQTDSPTQTHFARAGASASRPRFPKSRLKFQLPYNSPKMFPYDRQIADAVRSPAQSISDVLAAMRTIDLACADGDGLKWFNWLYLQVTGAVETRIAGGGFSGPAWLTVLDVRFANLYFTALRGHLTGGECPGCWAALFSVRGDARIARIQFALAGINAHINHDLPEAIVQTCAATNTVPQHGSAQYTDYTNLNSTLDGLIETAKKTLHVRLLGDPLPPVTHLEDAVAAWGTAAAREQAWNNSEVLWHLRDVPSVATGFLAGLDGITAFASKTLLAPVP